MIPLIEALFLLKKLPMQVEDVGIDVCSASLSLVDKLLVLRKCFWPCGS